MKISRFVLVSVLAVLSFSTLEFVHVPQAHAVVGRPLTPVSVAGVARRTSRRTARRCAVGMYYCGVDKQGELYPTV
jgi:hypothetical protein